MLFRSAFAPGLSKEAIAGVIAACGLPPTVRGEALDMEALAALADGLHAAQSSYGSR